MNSQNVPRLVSVRKAAAAETTISGQLAPGNVPRVDSAVLGVEDALAVELNFGHAENGKKTVAVKIIGSAQMQCQRCLEPVQVAIKTDSTLTVVAHDEEARSTIRDIEPLLLAGDELDIYELVEEEILLALPIVALHSADDCAMVKLAGEPSNSPDSHLSQEDVNGNGRMANDTQSPDRQGETGNQAKPNPFAALKQLKQRPLTPE